MRVLITGGAGFIGCNTAKRASGLGHDVVILDNLSRRGSRHNLEWLQSHGPIRFFQKDVRDEGAVKDLIKQERFDAIIHLAAQVAVTTSVVSPREDFEMNMLGTLNVLEGVRLCSPDTAVIYASTNKVYGLLSSLKMRETATRYELCEQRGISEDQPLDFDTPYGCSKGAADQYVLDYSRTYGLRTVSLRQSCIYGYRQFGIEDQGWVAWFIIAHLLNRPITIYGDGKQVRDVLFIDDLVDCYIEVLEKIESLSGRAFNVGGGPENTMSLLELVECLGQISGRPVKHQFADWRPGDQRVFVCNIDAAKSSIGWAPRVRACDGIGLLYRWAEENLNLFAEIHFAGGFF